MQTVKKRSFNDVNLTDYPQVFQTGFEKMYTNLLTFAK